MSELRFLLSGERYLEQAESVLDDWAIILADAGRDSQAGEVLRVKSALLGLRCEFLERDKAP